MGFLNNLFAQPTPEEAEGYNVATTRQMVCFGMEGFPAIVFSGLISTLYMYFSTNVAGITIEAAGVILAIASIFDAVTDPIFGTIVDKYKISKKYRYIPWYVMGVVFICIGMIGIFFGPNVAAPAAWMMCFYLVQAVGGTFLTVSISPLRNILTNEPGQRSILPFFSNVFGGVGGMLSLVITQPLVDLLTKTFGREVVAWRIVTMGYMLLALMSISLVVSATKEKDRQFMESGVEPYQLKDLLPLLRENHPLQMLAIAVATNDLATGMQNATLVYFFLYVMHNKDLQPIATVVGAPFMLVAILLAPYIAKKTDRRRVFVQGSWVGALMPVAILLLRPFAYPVITLLLMGLNSFCSTYIGSVKWSLMSDCVDYGRWKTGKFAPGAYASIFSFLEKVMKSLSGAIVGFALGRAGFSEGAQAQGAIVLALIVFFQFAVPMLGHIASIISMRFFGIDAETYRQMNQNAPVGERVESGSKL